MELATTGIAAAYFPLVGMTRHGLSDDVAEGVAHGRVQEDVQRGEKFRSVLTKPKIPPQHRNRPRDLSRPVIRGKTDLEREKGPNPPRSDLIHFAAQDSF